MEWRLKILVRIYSCSNFSIGKTEKESYMRHLGGLIKKFFA